MCLMRLTLDEIKEKEVVNLTDGACFGFPGDILMDTETKSVLALVIKGKLKLFGLLGKEDDVMISWEKIETIGKDTILVKTGPEYLQSKSSKKSSFSEAVLKFFDNF